jgi:hypothetical protein
VPEASGIYDRETFEIAKAAPEVLAIARAAFDQVCAALPPDRDDQSTRVLIAERILREATAGERDPDRLRAIAQQGL